MTYIEGEEPGSTRQGRDVYGRREKRAGVGFPRSIGSQGEGTLE